MKYKHALGLDIDHYTMRGVVLSAKPHGKKPHVVVEKMAEIRGTFIKDSDVVKGIKKLREELGVHGHKNRIASALGGKQVYTTRMAFQKVPESSMRKALKFEIRKELPFEASSATLEYQKLTGEVRHDDKMDLMVTAATNALIGRHLRLLTEGGLKPAIVEALPLMVANTFWLGVRKESVDAANIILHIGPDIATLVIDGEHLPYFNRLIYFSAEELFAPGEEEATITGKERARRMETLAEELIRSLSYYEENFENVSFSTVNLIGAYADPELLKILKEKTQLTVAVSDLTSRVHSKEDLSPGQYDLSIALALQALE